MNRERRPDGISPRTVAGLRRLWRFRPALLLGLLLVSTLAQAADRLPLWEARGAQGTLYLFGSIHVCKASCFPLPEAALKRLRTSQTLVVELDPQNPEVQTKLLMAAQLPAGQRLEKLLPAGDWQAFKDTSAQLGMPAEVLAGMQPWMAGTVLTLVAAQRSGFETAQGIDLALMAEGAEAGLPLEELETAEEQIAAFGAGGAEAQRQSLRQSVDLLRSGRLAAYLEHLLQAWRAGDTSRLQSLLAETLPPDTEIARALIERRNLRMAERLNSKMQDRRSRFVVVGVGHLVGPQSIPALLAKRGYRVRQLGTAD